MRYEYTPGWMQSLAARIVVRERSEKIAGCSVWSVTEEQIAAMRPHQRGHMRRAAKLLARAGWRDNQIRADEVLCMLSGPAA